MTEVFVLNDEFEFCPTTVEAPTTEPLWRLSETYSQPGRQVYEVVRAADKWGIGVEVGSLCQNGVILQFHLVQRLLRLAEHDHQAIADLLEKRWTELQPTNGDAPLIEHTEHEGVCFTRDARWVAGGVTFIGGPDRIRGFVDDGEDYYFPHGLQLACPNGAAHQAARMFQESIAARHLVWGSYVLAVSMGDAQKSAWLDTRTGGWLPYLHWLRNYGLAGSEALEGTEPALVDPAELCRLIAVWNADARYKEYCITLPRYNPEEWAPVLADKLADVRALTDEFNQLLWEHHRAEVEQCLRKDQGIAD